MSLFFTFQVGEIFVKLTAFDVFESPYDEIAQIGGKARNKSFFSSFFLNEHRHAFHSNRKIQRFFVVISRRNCYFCKIYSGGLKRKKE